MVLITFGDPITKIYQNRLSRDLYKDPNAGIREYINNEARPCRSARRQGFEASIHVTVNPKSRTITIEGRDSMGMTLQTFRDVYTVLGRSGNLDEYDSGQFGFGKASYLCLSDIIVFETYSRKTNRKFGFIGKGGKVYEPIPEQNLSITQYGSKVTMTVRKSVKIYDVVSYIKNVSKFLEVPVFLELTSSVASYYDEDTGEESGARHEKGIAKIGPIDEKQFLLEECECDRYDPFWVEIETDDYHLVGALTGSYDNCKMNSYLVGIPIDMDKIPNPGFHAYVLNIKNERKYMPTVSRDNLSAESMEKLFETITADLCEYFAKITLEKPHDYNESEFKPVIKLAKEIGSEFGFGSRIINFSMLLGDEFEAIDAQSIKTRESTWIISDQFADILKRNQKLYYLYNAAEAKIKAFLEIEPESIVIVPTGDRYERQAKIAQLVEFEIPNLTEYLKSKNIKTKLTPVGDVVVHFGGYSSATERLNLEELDSNCIRVPADVPLRDSLERLCDAEFRSFGMFKDAKKFAGTDSVTLEEFCKHAAEQSFDTTDGPITGAQIIKKCKSGIVLLRAFDSEFEEHLTLEKCKDLTNAKLVIRDIKSENGPSPAVCLMLAYTAKHGAVFEILGNKHDETIRTELLEHLGISTRGKWRYNAKKAIRHLGQISNGSVRELYAMTCNHVFRYDSGWGSDEKDTKKTVSKLHKTFVAIDKNSSEKSMVEICREIVETADEDSGSIEMSMAEIAMKQVAKEIKQTSKTTEESIITAVRMVMENKISGLLDIHVTEKSYKNVIILKMDVQPLEINDNHMMYKVLREITDRHYSEIDAMTITQDNKLELVFA